MVIVQIAASGLKIAEVYSYESNRIHGASNLNAVKDGLRILCGVREAPAEVPSCAAPRRPGRRMPTWCGRAAGPNDPNRRMAGWRRSARASGDEASLY
jgi:hypothetical protein